MVELRLFDVTVFSCNDGFSAVLESLTCTHHMVSIDKHNDRLKGISHIVGTLTGPPHVYNQGDLSLVS